MNHSEGLWTFIVCEILFVLRPKHELLPLYDLYLVVDYWYHIILKGVSDTSRVVGLTWKSFYSV